MFSERQLNIIAILISEQNWVNSASLAEQLNMNEYVTIVAGTMSIAVSLIAVPQAILFTLLFFLAKLIVPITTPELLLDFMACGGILTLAAGLRVTIYSENEPCQKR